MAYCEKLGMSKLPVLPKRQAKKTIVKDVKGVFDCDWLFSVRREGITKDSMGYFSLEKVVCKI